MRKDRGGLKSASQTDADCSDDPFAAVRMGVISASAPDEEDEFADAAVAVARVTSCCPFVHPRVESPVVSSLATNRVVITVRCYSRGRFAPQGRRASRYTPSSAASRPESTAATIAS